MNPQAHTCSVNLDPTTKCAGRCANSPGTDTADRSDVMPDPTRPYRKRAIPMAERRALALRYGSKGETYVAQCAYCDATGIVSWHGASWVTFGGLEIDHIIAEFNGGPNTADNLTLACRPCNRRKGAT